MPARAASYTDDTRVEALARLAANDGNVHLTSRQLSIPRPTIVSWRNAVMPSVVAPLTPLNSPVLAERVREEIEHIGFGNLSDVVSWDKDAHLVLTASDELTPRQAALISEIRVKRRWEAGKTKDDPSYEVEDIWIKTRDKLGALKVLAEASGVLPKAGIVINNDNRQLTVEAERLAGVLGIDAREILAEVEGGKTG